MNPISLTLAVILGGIGLGATALTRSPVFVVVLGIAALLVLTSVKVARQWEKAIVLRAGKKRGAYGPGLFLMIPVFDTVAAWVDQRIQTSPFNAEKALTRDTTPVDVDAVVFWLVHDTEKAALEVADYRSAVGWVSQTSLREMIGSSDLSELLSDCKAADERLREEIGRKTAEWGITVSGVEIRDIRLPETLQDAMSRQAQAEREKQARVTLASAEIEVANQLDAAARIYEARPSAMQLLQINRIYEMNKDRGTTILIPTGMVNSMGAVLALTQAAGQPDGDGNKPR